MQNSPIGIKWGIAIGLGQMFIGSKISHWKQERLMILLLRNIGKEILLQDNIYFI
jgi:hypothetical protein